MSLCADSESDDEWFEENENINNQTRNVFDVWMMKMKIFRQKHIYSIVTL